MVHQGSTTVKQINLAQKQSYMYLLLYICLFLCLSFQAVRSNLALLHGNMPGWYRNLVFLPNSLTSRSKTWLEVVMSAFLYAQKAWSSLISSSAGLDRRLSIINEFDGYRSTILYDLTTSSLTTVNHFTPLATSRSCFLV